MAESVHITTRENAAKVVVDGNEISDVLEYELKENGQGAVLTLRILVNPAAGGSNPPPRTICGHGVAAAQRPSKPPMRVRFPLPAPPPV